MNRAALKKPERHGTTTALKANRPEAFSFAGRKVFRPEGRRLSNGQLTADGCARHSISSLESTNRLAQISGTSDASKTQSGLIGSYPNCKEAVDHPIHQHLYVRLSVIKNPSDSDGISDRASAVSGGQKSCTVTT
jgi:hypothetical protein